MRSRKIWDMKLKQQESRYESLKGLIVNLSELELMIQRLKDRDLLISIEDKDAVYESLNDVIESRGTRPDYLSIKGESKDSTNRKSINIEFKVGEVYVFGSRDLAADFIMEVQKSKRWYYNVVKQFFLMIGLAIWSLTFIIACPNESFYQILTISFCSFFIISAFVSFQVWKGSFRLNLVKGHESNFFKRNKEKLMFAIVTGVISFISGLILGYILK